MKERPADERTLLKMISEGDESAFRKVYDAYYDHIYNAAYSFTKSPHISEDIVQEVFCRVWHRRATLPDVEKFDAYLFIMARNHILTEMKSRLRHNAFVNHLRAHFTEASDSQFHDLIAKESESIIRDAVDKLPPQQKTVFSLSREEGLSQDEIAARMNISKNTVRNHMNAALRFIRHYMHLSNRIIKSILIQLLIVIMTGL